MPDIETTATAPREPSLLFFDHPYPRYGLAVSLVRGEVGTDWRGALEEPETLLQCARTAIAESMQQFRVHTPDDRESDLTLQYHWLSNEDLETSGQKAEDGYYIGPHVVINDRNVRYLIKEARSALDDLDDPSSIDPQASVKMKRSFAPFTSKLNQGTKSLSEPKSTRLEAVFSLVAALTPVKPAGQVDFTNQVMIPDLDLDGMVQFVRLFQMMQKSEHGGGLTLKRTENSNRKRPPLFDGNYPDAPRSSAFGPVGLMGAIGQWAERAGRLDDALPVLKKMAGSPIYLVSYVPDLMRQEYIGHHVARLAEEQDLPAVIGSLFRSRFYNDSDNRPDSTNRKGFLRMASRFLQLYTRPAFKDFLAYRVQYEPVFSSILTDYFMSTEAIDSDIVRSARAYGAYLNSVAYHIARNEIEENEQKEGGGTGRTLYEAKTRALAQLESTALSARRPSALFAQLNVDAGRQANRDVPAEAERFLEATNTGEIDFDVAKDLVLAYMRLRSNASSTSGSDSTVSDGAPGKGAAAGDEESSAGDASPGGDPSSSDAEAGDGGAMPVDETGYVEG